MFHAHPIKNGAESSLTKVYGDFHGFAEPTAEELEYVCTSAELKLLCQHYDVKVDISKFNDLDHFYQIFKKRGSLENRSKESTLRLLQRTCNHYRNDKRHAYNEQEIADILQEEWEVRKSQTVRYLKKLNENPTNETFTEKCHLHKINPI